MNNHETKRTACLAPLLSIAVQPQGRLRPCCWWWGTNKNELDHNIQSMSFTEYRNTVGKNLYKNMQQGVYPDSCKRCNTSAKPRYEYYNNLYPDYVGREFEDVPNLKHLDLRFGNLCNASCVTCNYTNSNYFGKVKEQGYWLAPGQVPSEEERVQLDRDMDWHNSPKAIKSIIDSLVDVDYIYTTGGEPTINPTLHKVMQHLIDIGRAPDITIEINTNGTNSNKKFLDLFKPFKKVILFSMDAHGELNDVMRFPTKFTQIEKNFFAFNKICTGDDLLMITPCITIHNFFALPNLLNWANKNKVPITAKLNILNAPHWQSIARLNRDQLDIGFENIKAIETVLTTRGNILPTRLFVEDMQARLSNKSVYPPFPKDKDNLIINWQTSIDYTRKWFESRGYDPKITNIPEFQ